MQKHNLLLAGGALLATTALSTSAMALSLHNANTLSTFFNVPKVANTLIGGNTPSSITLGGQTLFVDVSADYGTKFNVLLVPSGGKISSGSVTAAAFEPSGTGISTTAISEASICTVTPTPDLLLVQCDPSVGTTADESIGAISLTGVVYNNAAALATSGAAIALSGTVRDNSNSVTFETMASMNVVQSITGISLSGNANAGTATLTGAVTVPFSQFTVANGGLTATTARLATVSFNYGTSAVTTDLATTFTAATSAFSDTELKLTHSSLSDSAVSAVVFEGAASNEKTPAQFVSGTVSHTATTAQIAADQSWNINVRFNGTAAIAAAASGTVVATPSLGAVTLSVPGATTVNTAVISRGGLSTEINSAVPSTQTGFQSFVRIVSQAAYAAPVTITVHNDTTGAQIGGTYTSADIATRGSLQVSSAQIEAGAGITAAMLSGVSALRFRISGSFNGFVQHILYNSTTGQLADFSAFRQGGSAAGTQNAP